MGHLDRLHLKSASGTGIIPKINAMDLRLGKQMTPSRLRQILAGALSMIVLGVQAQAQSGDWSVSGSIVHNDDDPHRAVADSTSGVQFTFGRELTENLTIEGLLGYSDIEGYVDPGEAYPDQQHLDIGVNILAFYDREKAFAPYALVGLGYLGVKLDPGGDDSGATATAGLGLRQRFGDSPWSLRVEARVRRQFEGQFALGGSGPLNDIIGTIGVQYDFGHRLTISEPDKPADSDSDGVLDMWDECPNTSPGVEVTSRGCEIMDMDRDDDGDRVPNRLDDCPNTPAGAAVGRRGCALDSDNDGVPTDRDRCPASRPGAEVDQFGCESDSDSDGVLNQYDRCPDSAPGVRVDIRGCEISDVISLPGVNFTTGSDLLEPGAENILRDAAATLNKHPNLKVEVAGHTDNVGNMDSNLGLSDRRAKTVLDYLVKFGVDPARLTFRGYGDMDPIADNNTAEGRATNRRVELRVISW